jgi:hypothetical protein
MAAVEDVRRIVMPLPRTSERRVVHRDAEDDRGPLPGKPGHPARVTAA